MKSLKKLMPVLMIVLLVLSFTSLVNNAVTTRKEYKAYIKQAEEASKKLISVDVDEAYSNALEINSNSDIYISWAEYYASIEDYETAKSLCETAQESFPKEAEIYEKIMKYDLKLNANSDFFSTYDKALSLKASNKEIEKLYNANKYLFETDWSSYSEAYAFSNGYSVVGNATDNGMMYGYYSEEETIDVMYKSAGAFSDSETMIAPVIDQNNQVYYINSEGKRKNVISPKNITVKKLGVYNCGVLTVYDGSKYYLSNLDSEVIAGPYDYISTINDNLGVAKEGNSWFIINEKGEKINNDVYDGFILNDKEIAFDVCFFAKKGDVYYLIDSEGKKISNDTYTDARLFKDGYAAVKNADGWGFIDEKGKLIVNYQFDDAKSFSNGLAPVFKNGYWGYIALSDDNKVIEAIACQFDDALQFIALEDGGHIAFVNQNGSWKIINIYI